MPAKVALSIYILLVLILLYLDSKKWPQTTAVLWVPLVWIMYCGSRAISNWLNFDNVDPAEIDYSGGSPIDRTFLTALIVLGLLILKKRQVNWRKVFGDNACIFALFIYIGVSVLWSDFIDISFKRWIRSIGDLVMVLVILTESSPVKAMTTVLRRCSFVLIPMSVVLIKYVRDLGISYNAISGVEMWIGVTTHKNSLGYLACTSGIYCFWEIAKGWQLKNVTFYSCLLILAMTMWILNGPSISNSKTSLINFIIGVLLLTFSQFFKKNPRLFIRYIFWGGACMLLFISLSPVLFDVSVLTLGVAASGRDMTLTGRTDLWEELLKIGSNHIVLGSGFGGFWLGDRLPILWAKFEWGPESAHNGYIDVYLELGLIGLFIVGAIMVSTFRNILNRMEYNFEYGSFRLVAFILILLYNITESSLAKPTSLIWFLFLLIAIYPGDKAVGVSIAIQRKR